jgi:hypothetical protein
MTKTPGIKDLAKKLARKAVGLVVDRLLPKAETPPLSRAAPRPSPDLPAPSAAPVAPVAVTLEPPRPAEKEPFGMLDLEEPPETYGQSEVGVLAQDPSWLFAWWEATPAGWDQARAALGGDGGLTLRLRVLTRSGESTVDHRLTWDHGRTYVPAPTPGSRVAAALGLLADDGRFAPIAAAPPVRVPWAGPGPAEAVEWLEVTPRSMHGRDREVPLPRPAPPETSVRVPHEPRERGDRFLADHVPGSLAPKGRAGEGVR